MKLTIILIAAALFSARASGVAQTISLSGKDLTLKEVFAAIKKQTGYVAFINEQDLAGVKPVTVKANKMGLPDLLDLVLKDQPLNWTIRDKTIFLSRKLEARKPAPDLGFPELFKPKQLSGKVKDSVGNPLSGATVQNRNSKVSVTSVQDGAFSISADEGDIIVVSYVGFEPARIIVSAAMIEGETMPVISLKNAATRMDEVVVAVNTGYQNIPKERATGSFVQIDNKTLNLQVGPNILDRLNGIVPGMLFDKKLVGAKANLGIMIRGQSTITGPRDPLIILDNFPYDGKIENINPNDIESVTILKDAAAASVWGARAGNGVIVLTTKKAQFNQATTVNAGANITVTEKSDLFSVPGMATTDIVDVEMMLFSNKRRFSDTAWSAPFSELYEILFKRMNGQITSSDSAALIDALRQRDLRSEYMNKMYRAAVNRQYFVNLKTGSSRSATYISAGYDDNISELYAQNKRLVLKINNQMVFLKNFQLNTNVHLINAQLKSGRPAFNSTVPSYGFPQYSRLFDENGNALPLSFDFRNIALDTMGSGRLGDNKFYPGTNYQHQNVTNKLQDILANAGVSWKLGGLKISASYQYENQTDQNRDYKGKNSYEGKLAVNLYAKVDPVSGNISYPVPRGGYVTIFNKSVQQHVFRFSGEFNKQWDDHEVNSFVGFEARHGRTTEERYRYYGYNEDPVSVGSMDYKNPYRHNINGAMITFQDMLHVNGTTNRFISYFANGAYTYKRRYILSFSARRDASNLFGVNTNDKWRPFWSIGGAWLLSNEDWYRVDKLSMLKLRVTYGIQGNVDQALSAVTTLTYLNNNQFTSHPAALINNFYNPLLRWETIGMFNAGLDFSVANGRISGSLEWYRKSGNNLYSQVPVDPTLGLNRSSITGNIGQLRTTGIDMEITGRITTGKLKWSSTLTLLHSKDIVLKHKSTQYSSAAYSPSGRLPLEGYPLQMMVAYKWGGLDPATGRPIGFLRGEKSTNFSEIENSAPFSDLVNFGSNIPLYDGNFNNTISWKSFSLTASIKYRLNYFVRKQSINYTSLFYRLTGHSDYYKRWQKPGDEAFTNIPSMSFPGSLDYSTFYEFSEVNVRKGDHLRLQFVMLTWQLPVRNNHKLMIDGLTVSFNASNLGILWKAAKDMDDPDNTGIQTPRAFNLGLNITLK